MDLWNLNDPAMGLYFGAHRKTYVDCMALKLEMDAYTWIKTC